MTSCNHQAEIIGHWRPADLFQVGEDSNGVDPKFRDFILNRDSTFISVGFDQQPKQTEGWHNGFTQKGTWSFSNDILFLMVEGVSYPVKFKILKLTDKEMIMESEFMESVDLKLVRLKH